MSIPQTIPDLYPIPDAQGIAKTKDLYVNRFGTVLTDEQAADVLGRVIRFFYSFGV